MWRVTRNTSVRLNRSVLVNKRTLLVGVTLDAGCIGASRESCLLEFETAVWVVAIAALHRTFQHFVMKGQVELVLRLAVTTEAELRLRLLKQSYVGNARSLGIRC